MKRYLSYYLVMLLAVCVIIQAAALAQIAHRRPAHFLMNGPDGVACSAVPGEKGVSGAGDGGDLFMCGKPSSNQGLSVVIIGDGTDGAGRSMHNGAVLVQWCGQDPALCSIITCMAGTDCKWTFHGEELK